jgi:hypothetical protein
VCDDSARRSMHRSVPRRSWAATRPSVGQHYCFEITRYKIYKSSAGKRCWPHPRVRYLFRGGPRGHCLNLADRVPSHTSSKSRRRARHELTRVHVSRGSSSRLLAQDSSGAATCPVAPIPPPDSGQLQSRHVFHGSSSRPWLRAAPEPSHVPWLQLPPLGLGQLRNRHVSRGALRAVDYWSK